ncbi:hypothetical protein LPB67_06485 [Undibacterium sp. Jales W-56]|uniref:hypothetical protein n=1 Tax=Undibacterium sp. Jales W-56 TaxID=2897325 RepID=UPI0021D27C7F|nr:hypothetical protein [Undibacterium sp. Jales W-56]MCU6433427.1 hypothetical protein [Undibacterium sp. Jales W-56]
MSNNCNNISKPELYSAWFMLIDGGIGLFVSASMMITQQSINASIAPPYTSILGLLSGLLALRGRLVGLIGGLLFYGVQIVSYYSHDMRFNFRSGISLAAVIHLTHGTAVINMVAVVGLATVIWILKKRFYHPINSAL